MVLMKNTAATEVADAGDVPNLDQLLQILTQLRIRSTLDVVHQTSESQIASDLASPEPNRQSPRRNSGFSARKSQLEITIASDFPSHSGIAMWHCLSCLRNRIRRPAHGALL